jgi:hypothetical protein
MMEKVIDEELNKRYLVNALARVREVLEWHTEHPGEVRPSPPITAKLSRDNQQIREEMPYPPPVEIICKTLRLTLFELNILLWCAGVELDSSLLALSGKLNGSDKKAYPTFGLALAALPEAHWSALSPERPLRYWRLVEINHAENLTTAQLKIDECILHYITGLRYYDERLKDYIKPAPPPGELVPSHLDIARQASAVMEHLVKNGQMPVLQLFGSDSFSQHAIAGAVCTSLGYDLQLLSTQVMPHESRDLEALARLWNRQAALTGSALLIDSYGIENSDHATENALHRFIREMKGILFLTGRERRILPEHPSISFEVHKPTSIEQQNLWQHFLNDEKTDILVDSLVSQFNLNTRDIHLLYEETKRIKENQNGNIKLKDILWDVCRAHARPRMEELAQRINSPATWEDLVISDSPHLTLKEIAAQVRQRLKVFDLWGFRSRISRGLGVTALFTGSSGTGKTMAAEVLANDLHQDLYRIDLSQVVSKYIGETEKNLRRVFDAAEDGGTILLFDEADALFGKRSEVKDSHDRYANIEVSYLLQRMEDYRGLAILTTNMKDALDTAFLRRIRFIIQFSYPDMEQRREIWRRIFPSDTPRDGLDLDKLAMLNVAGGNIKNIAVYAAFLAADAGEPVRMSHILRAARVEYDKLEMTLTDSEIRGWV